MPRWIRLDTTWSQSAWLASLSPAARLVWVELLCYVKAHGTNGSVKAITPEVIASRYVTGVTRDAVSELLEAAQEHGAITLEDGEWTICQWSKYQGDPTAKARSRRYRKSKSRLSPLRDVTGVTRDHSDVTPTETETGTQTDTPSLRSGDARARRAMPLPGDWGPSDGHVEIAEAEGRDIDREAAAFRDHALANGRKQKDWDAAFRNWLRSEYGRPKDGPDPSGFGERGPGFWAEPQDFEPGGMYYDDRA